MPSIVVVGSINLDFVATAQYLPTPGKKVTHAVITRYPGGTGANQALAAHRLGAEAALVGRVGKDAEADAALALLREGGVDLSGVVAVHDAATGVALIAVAASGENQIVVAPGANLRLASETLELPSGDALIGEVQRPVDTVARAVAEFEGFTCVNLGPPQEVDDAVLRGADLIVVNEFGGGLAPRASCVA